MLEKEYNHLRNRTPALIFQVEISFVRERFRIHQESRRIFGHGDFQEQFNRSSFTCHSPIVADLLHVFFDAVACLFF